MSIATIVIIGVLTFACRAAFLLLGRTRPNDGRPDVLARVPAAVLPALTASALLPFATHGDWQALIAAASCGLIAWRTRSLLAGVTIGLGVWWALQAMTGFIVEP